MLVVTVLVASSAARAQGVGDYKPLQGYSLASWAERDGVPIGPIYALAQDQDGYLWLGTESGLLRFDGIHFLTSEALGYAELPTDRVRALLSSRDGTLWAGFGPGADFGPVAGGGLYAVDGAPAAAPARYLDGVGVIRIAETHDGALWVATSNGLYALDKHGVLRVEPAGVSWGVVRHVYVDDRGTLWVGTSRGLFERHAGTFRRAPSPDRLIRGISRSHDDNPWITHPTRGFVYAGDDLPAEHDFEGVGTGVYRDSRDNLWVSTRGQGLLRVYRAVEDGPLITERASVDTGFRSDGIWAVHEDMEGNIWVGTQEGLHRLMPHEVTPLTSLGFVHAVKARADGSVWIGTARGLLLGELNAEKRIETRQILIGHEVRALATTPDGTLWVATPWGIFRLQADGRLAELPLAGGMTLAEVRSLATSVDGTVWAADADLGLFRVVADQVEAVRLHGDTQAAGVSLVHVDREDRLWLAFADGRIGMATHDGGLELVAGDRRAQTFSFAEDPHGTLWIGGGDGLSRVRHGRLETLGYADGLPDSEITAIAIDSSGTMWAATNRSIICIDLATLDARFAEPGVPLSHRRFTSAHGVAGVPVPVRGSNKVTFGPGSSLWFVTGRGITVVEPDTISKAPRSLNSRVQVDSILVDDQRLAVADSMAIPASTTRLEIAYTALQLSRSTTPRFRYQLEGFDPAWVDAGTQGHTVYTNLPPGGYRFLVQAEGEDRSWSAMPAELGFTVLPAFHQTPMFYLVLFLALTGLAWAAWTTHVRIAEQRFSLALAERARLSREMHDTLLQSLVGFALQLDSIAHPGPSTPEATQDRLIRMRKQVEGYIREVRQSIWDLRSPIARTGDLVSTLREAGQRLATSGAVFHFSVHGTPRPQAERIERNLLRIGQEAITNAVRHAAATRIVAEVRYLDDAVVLRVSDNGRGFEVNTATQQPGHYGIVSMRERAAELSGSYDVRSSLGRGTVVEVRVPVA